MNIKYLLKLREIQFFACIAACGIITEVYADANSNLIPNGNFEEVSGNSVKFWDMGYTWDGDYKTTKDMNIKYSGTQSIKIENTGNTGKSAWVLRKPISVEEKTGYQLNIHVKASGTSSISIQCTCYRSTGKNINMIYNLRPGTYDWEKYTFSFEMPEGTDKVGIYLFNTGKGTVWFDDLSLEKYSLSQDEKEKVITENGIKYFYSPRKRQQDQPLTDINKTEKENGCITYHRNNPRDTYPDSIPRREEVILDGIKDFTTPGQYCTLWFSIYALQDLKNVKIEINDDFKSIENANSIIKKENVKLKIIKCWPQMDGYFSRTYYIIPELLENLHPADIAKNTSQSFWISIKIPANTQAGIYEGTASIRLPDNKEQALKLKVNILPFKLLEPSNNFWGMVADDFRWDNMTDEEMERDILDMTEYGITAFDGLLDIGKNCSFYQEGENIVFKSERLKRFLQIRKKLNIKAPITIAGRGIIPLSPDFANDNKAQEKYKNCIKAIDDFIKTIAGSEYSDWYFVGPDEPHNDPNRMKNAEIVYALAKNAGIKTCCTTYLDWSIRKLGPDLNVIMTAIGASSKSVNEKRNKLLKELNLKYWLIGGGCYTGEEGGLMPNRYKCGFLFYKTNAEGCISWTYQRPLKDKKGDPYNDFDTLASYKGQQKEYGITYPSKNKSRDEVSIFTLQWEGIREGIEDYKYVYTLKEFIRKAEISNNETLQKAAADAKEKLQWMLDSIPWTGDYTTTKFDNHMATKIRWALAQEIMRLKKMLETNGDAI